MTKHPETKEEKKKKLRDKLRKDNFFYENVKRMMGVTQEVKEKSKEAPKKNQTKTVEEEHNKLRLSTIRDRTNGSRRLAASGWMERMNTEGNSGFERTR